MQDEVLRNVFDTRKVPPVAMVAPEYVFATLSTKVPPPSFDTLYAPLNAPLSVILPLLATEIVGDTCNAMGVLIVTVCAVLSARFPVRLKELPVMVQFVFPNVGEAAKVILLNTVPTGKSFTLVVLFVPKNHRLLPVTGQSHQFVELFHELTVANPLHVTGGVSTIWKPEMHARTPPPGEAVNTVRSPVRPDTTIVLSPTIICVFLVTPQLAVDPAVKTPDTYE